MDEIVIFKLKNGEEIIARFAGESSEGYTILRKVRVFHLVPVDQSGKLGIKLLPYCMGSPDADFNLRTDFIGGEPKEIPEEMKKSYIQATTSIQLPR